MARTEITVVGHGELARALGVPLETVANAHARGQITALCETSAGEPVFAVGDARRALAARGLTAGAGKR